MWRPASLALVVAACGFRPSLEAADDTAGDDAIVDGDPHAEAGAPHPEAGTPAPHPEAGLDAPSLLSCPASYGLHDVARPNSFYRLQTASASWGVAEAACEADTIANVTRPTHLIVYDDLAELAWDWNLTTTQKWTGASDRITEGTIKVVTNQSTFFLGGASGNVPPKDCVMLSDGSSTSTEKCDDGHPYVCECDGAAANHASF